MSTARKLLCLALTLVLLAVSVACSRNEASPVSSASEDTVSGAEPAGTPSPAPKTTPEPAPTLPIEREAVTHDWNSADTLYPYAIGAYALHIDVFPGDQGVLVKEKGRLRYLDYATGDLLTPCSLPDCLHDATSCEAY